MSRDFLSVALDVLNKTAQRAGDSEVNAKLDELERLSEAEDRTEDFKAFRNDVSTIIQLSRNSAVSERGLNLLIDTTHDLSSTLKLQDLLHTIVTRARSLVGANIAWVTILDDEGGLFRTAAAEGYLSPATAEMTSDVQYGAVSLIMNSKSFFDTQDYLNDQRFQHLPELDQTFEAENIVSLAGFPILSGDEVHGFLFVADRYSRKLSGREISVLGSFALHAGVAMRNANTFNLLSEALDEARRNREALVDHIQRVEASASAHDDMTSLLASGADLQHFLQRMASQISGAIFLYDDELQIREEFTSENYRGGLAQDIKVDGLNSKLLINANTQSRHTGQSVVMLESSDEQCRVIALHGGTGRGESLVICHQGELDAIEIRNIERSTVALSIAKLWNEKRETEKLIASSTLLRHLVLVKSPDEATISAIRDRLSLLADQSVVLAIISITGLDRAAQTAIVRESASKIDLMVDLFDDTYLAVGPEDVVRAFLKNLAKRQNGWKIGGVLSQPFADLTSTPNHFQQISQALRVLRKMGRLDRLVEQSEVNLFAKLFETGDAARIARYLEQVLLEINAKASRQRTQLKQTLLCYFENQYNMKRTSDALELHINTVRQRLETLREITGGWDEPVKALELHIALRMDAILKPSKDTDS